jgi:hypothetical protein
MSWQVRDGHQYYYLTRRKNGSRQTVYFGRGPIAQLAAADVDAGKLHREQLRGEFCTTRSRLRSLDGLIREIDQGARMLLEAALLAEGFYPSHRHWRGTRRVRALSSSG